MFEEVIVAAIYSLDPATGEATLLRELVPPSFSACVDFARQVAVSGEDLLVKCIYYVGRAGEPA